MKVEPGTRIDILLAALPVRDSVNGLLRWSGGLSVCRTSATAFINATDEALNWWGAAKQEDKDKPDYAVDTKFRLVIDKAKTFETVLSEELVTSSAYSATKKGIYSTADLIENAEKAFPVSVIGKFSEDTIREIQEAGKCLAFDMATACAFHMMRATEEVMHRYYVSACKPKPQRKLENWGAYIGELKKSGKAEVKEVVAMLQQIKDRHRNLIMHPEIVLSIDEAFTLFEIAQGAIIAMADDMTVRRKGKKGK
jgi:hypothetical protein